jgi:hypothetical protein
MSGEGFKDQGDGSESLLTVDDQERRLPGYVEEALLNVDNGADEVGGDIIVAPRA